MSSAAMPARRLSPIGNAQRIRAVFFLLRRQAKRVEVVPVERRDQVGRRQIGEVPVGLRLRVEMRNAVLAPAASASACRRRPSAGVCPRASTRSRASRRPLCAASARFFACAFSFSAEKCSQKFVTQYAPYAPVNACVRLSRSSRSAFTTSAPRAASARALSLPGSRVIARQQIRRGSSGWRFAQPAALRAGRSDHRDHFLVRHTLLNVTGSHDTHIAVRR